MKSNNKITITNKSKNNIYILLLILIIIIIIIFFILKKYKYIDLFEDNYVLPRTIWVFWDKEELSKDIALIYKNNKEKLTNWDIKLLNNNNVKDYLDITKFPNNYDTFSPQHKSDLIRLKLLKQNGGVWMDAGVIINSKDELEKLFKDTLDNKSELTAFTLEQLDNSYKYHQYIENWFLIAPQNSYIVSLWLEEFEKAYAMGFDEYGNHIKNDLKIKLCDRLIDSTYFTQHRAMQVVLQNRIITNNYVPNITLLKSEEYMFKLMNNCNWDFQCIKDKIENDKTTKNIPSIKLTGDYRSKGLDLEKYFSNNNNNNMNNIEPFINNINNNVDKYTLSRIIWIFWDKDLPKDIELIYKKNKEKLYNWDIKLLNNDNLKDYLDMNKFPKNYDTFKPQHKSDLIRLKLLKKYGGVWMDGGIIINSKDELEKLFKDTLDNRIELTAFTLGEKDNSYPYHQNIENWFLIAPQNSYIISLWLDEFEKAYDIGFDEYKKYITEWLKIKLCHNIDKFDTYLTQHMALQVVLQNRINNETNNQINNNNYIPKLLLLKSEDSMLKLSTECNWEKDCTMKNFEKSKNTPYIKLTRFERDYGLDIEKYLS